MNFDWEGTWHYVTHAPWIAGAAGAVVALRGAPGRAWWERCFNVASGALIAAYGTPALAEFGPIVSQAAQAGTAFALGLFGMNMVAAVLETVSSSTKLAELLKVILPWRGGPKP